MSIQILSGSKKYRGFLKGGTEQDILTLILYNGSAITSGFKAFDDDDVYTFRGNS